MDRYPEDRPDLIPDRDALACRGACYGMISSKSWYKWFFTFILDRKLTEEEAEEVWSKVTFKGPIPYEDTWGAAFERMDPNAPSFWRSQV